MNNIKFDHFKTLCQEKGLKATTQRYIIFKTLLENPVHPTADQLFEMVKPHLPGLARDTIYRTLSLLTDYGFVLKLGLAGSSAHYDADTNPHYHFICDGCGNIFDIFWPAFDQLPWPDTVFNLGLQIKFSAHFSGICRKCLAQ